MTDVPVSRSRLLARVESHLMAHSSPRLVMSLMVSVTALGGLVSSFVLLKAGVLSMAVRYPLATVMAYGVFLGCVWLWLRTLQAEPVLVSGQGALRSPGRQESGTPISAATEDAVDDRYRLMNAVADAIQRHDAAQQAASVAAPAVTETTLKPGGLLPPNLGDSVLSDSQYAGYSASSPGSSDSSGSRTSDGDGDRSEAGSALAVLVLVALLIVTIVAVGAFMISQAPAMLAEVALDGAVAGALYQRLRERDQQHWLVSAWVHTRWLLLVLVLGMGAIGWGLEGAAPGAVTLSQALGWATR